MVEWPTLPQRSLKCGEEYTLNKSHALQQQDALYSQQVETGASGRNMLCELKNTLAKALILIFFSLQCNQLITWDYGEMN